MSEARTQTSFEAVDAVLEWCLRNAQRMERLGEIEQAGLWGAVAAATAAEFGHSWLCSAPLESLLLRVGARLPGPSRWKRNAGVGSTKHWLHVFSRSQAGGHNALARRWIARNPFAELHSLVLTGQPASEMEPLLGQAIRASGGQVHSLEGTLFERAVALRELALAADVVALHIHMWDVLPSIAFAVPECPPVVLINHADHVFWVGSAIADIVVDIRDSGLKLTGSLRGVRASAVLPVPLEDHGPAPRDRSFVASRLADRSLLERDLILLTIGSPHKYQPVPELDFETTIARIVSAIQNCALISVGPDRDDALWLRIGARTGGRVAAVGFDADLASWHAAADLYLEGFPIGSYTALLEVALAGRAFVRKPYLAPPTILPVDRGALAPFDPPPDPDAYASAVIALAGDATRRDAMAQEARASVLEHHCGTRWDGRLEQLRNSIPKVHEVGLSFEPPRMPPALADYWGALHAASVSESPLAFAQRVAYGQGLRPRTDVAVQDALRKLQAHAR